MDDNELNGLLREWRAPDAPPSLRPPRARESWLRWLVAGTIRVPVPVALAVALLVTGWAGWMRAAAPAAERRRRIFQSSAGMLKPRGK